MLVNIRPHRLDPLAHQPELHPLPRTVTTTTAPPGSPDHRCYLGPRILLRQRYAEPPPAGHRKFCLLTKWALQRFGVETLVHSVCPHSAEKPFVHHWVCDVELDHVPDGDIREESFRLEVRRGRVTTVLIRAPTCWGALHALTTLKQYIRVEITQPKQTSCYADSPIVIEDAPIHLHRGAMVNTVTNFLPLPKMRQTVNLLAYFKMNVLHWQLGTSQGSRITDSVHESAAYTPQDVEHMLVYAHRRGVDILLEYDPPHRSPDNYLHKLQHLHRHLHYTCPYKHLGGTDGAHPGHEHVLRLARQPSDPDQLAQVCMDQVQPLAERAEAEHNPLDQEALRGMFRRHWAATAEQADRTKYVLWHKAYTHQPEVVVQCNEHELLNDHTLMIVSPTAWHIGDGTEPTLETVRRTTLPTNPHVVGGEICFWNPWSPSLTTLLAPAAHALWCGRPLEPEIRLEGLASYANRLWLPLAPPIGHAMDLRDSESIARTAEEAQAVAAAKKSGVQ